ncbi:MAG: hypothetical protein QXR81_06820 [Candidatus Nezhaarchaeales archaeon]
MELLGYTLAESIFRWRYAESKKHQRGPNEVYVTDLLLCGHRVKLAEKFPEVFEAENFNPVTLEGDLVHKGVQSVLKEILGDRVQVEVEGERTVAGVKLKGRMDAIIDGRHGVEIKHTKGEYGIPHPHHELQVKIYRWLFNLSSAELLYVSRDGVTSIPVWESATDEEVERLVKNPPVAREEWVCRFCPFSFACSLKVRRAGP